MMIKTIQITVLHVHDILADCVRRWIANQLLIERDNSNFAPMSFYQFLLRLALLEILLAWTLSLLGWTQISTQGYQYSNKYNQLPILITTEDTSCKVWSQNATLNEPTPLKKDLSES